jgi:hypothetical protein
MQPTWHAPAEPPRPRRAAQRHCPIAADQLWEAVLWRVEWEVTVTGLTGRAEQALVACKHVRAQRTARPVLEPARAGRAADRPNLCFAPSFERAPRRNTAQQVKNRQNSAGSAPSRRRIPDDLVVPVRCAVHGRADCIRDTTSRAQRLPCFEGLLPTKHLRPIALLPRCIERSAWRTA